jgi:hypothetical protein
MSVMKLGIRTRQALVAPEAKSRGVIHAEAPSTSRSEPDAETEALIQTEASSTPKLEPDAETEALIQTAAFSTPKPETEAEIEPLIQKIGATSIAEIEKLMGKLNDAKHFLQSEGERIQRETTRYTNLAQTASASVKIIFDTVREWRKAGHPVHNQSGTSAFEMPALAEDDAAREAQDEQQPRALG